LRSTKVSARGIRVTDGLVASLASAVGAAAPGGIVEIEGADPGDWPELERWSRVTGHAIVGRSAGPGGDVVRVRKSGHRGAARASGGPPEKRLWIYTNFDCNLRCDYCCARSSPAAARRALPLETISALAAEARDLGFDRICVTGGEPFLLPDIASRVVACAEALPTTVLTNAMLFAGPRRSELEAMPRERVSLQVSLDSPSPGSHDAHRGEGSWGKAREGIGIARALGFRVRVAATVTGTEEAEEMDRFLANEGVPAEDRVIRPVALRGFAGDGLALARAEVVPEPAVTAGGVFWHPVGADDADFLVTEEILPLSRALEAIEKKRAEDREFGAAVASVFNCA
jgi:hypothetical protein